MINFQNYLFMFGGIQDVTKEKNDINIYQCDKAQWSKIHTTTNSIYDCSPTLKKQSQVLFFKIFRKAKVHKESLQKEFLLKNQIELKITWKKFWIKTNRKSFKSGKENFWSNFHLEIRMRKKEPFHLSLNRWWKLLSRSEINNQAKSR